MTTPDETLGDALVHAADLIVDRWYERWRSAHPHPDLCEVAIKSALLPQIRLIGEQLRMLDQAPEPATLWQVAERLDPETRVRQDVPIEEVVHEYMLLASTVRDWIAAEGLNVSFAEYSYFYDAVFELAAESARRYTRYQAACVRDDRARYLAGIVHQMRSPLSSLAMQVDLLGRTVGEVEMGRLTRAVTRLRRLVEEVMRLERFKVHELPVSPKRVRLAELGQRVVADSEALASEKGLSLECAVPPDLEATIDEDLFVEALDNLVINAVKHTRTGFVRVQMSEDSGTLLCEVSDSGAGVSEEEKGRLFETVRPARGGGAGLGLVVAHRSIVAQGGTVGVRDRPGGGSVFWLRLPLEVVPRHDGRNDGAPESAGHGDDAKGSRAA